MYFSEKPETNVLKDFSFDLESTFAKEVLTEQDKKNIVDYLEFHQWKVSNGPEILKQLVQKEESELCKQLIDKGILLTLPEETRKIDFKWGAPTPHGSSMAIEQLIRDNIQAYMKTLTTNADLVKLLTDAHDPSLTRLLQKKLGCTII